MNVSQLRAFVAVVEKGSFSEAARSMGVSQPAVTMQLQALESDLGATLLERRYRRVDLTEAGRALLPHARKVLDQISDARDEIESLADTVTGHLSIAASTTPGAYLVPSLLGAFIAANPDVTVSVAIDDTTGVVAAVEAGDAQIAVAGAIVRGSKALFEEVGHDELVLIAPPGHELAKRTNIALSELCEERWVFREPGSGTREVSENILNDHGLDPSELRVAVELGTGEAVLAAVEGGLGVAVVSRFVANKALRLGTVVEVDAIGAPFRRALYTVLPKGQVTRAAEAFNGYLRDALA